MYTSHSLQETIKIKYFQYSRCSGKVWWQLAKSLLSLSLQINTSHYFIIRIADCFLKSLYLLQFLFREPKWSADEKLFALQVNNQILIYEDGKLERYVQRIVYDNLKSFSLSSGAGPIYYFAVFTLGKFSNLYWSYILYVLIIYLQFIVQKLLYVKQSTLNTNKMLQLVILYF